jgi:hypothetical protein
MPNNRRLIDAGGRASRTWSVAGEPAANQANAVLHGHLTAIVSVGIEQSHTPSFISIRTFVFVGLLKLCPLIRSQPSFRRT